MSAKVNQFDLTVRLTTGNFSYFSLLLHLFCHHIWAGEDDTLLGDDYVSLCRHPSALCLPLIPLWVLPNPATASLPPSLLGAQRTPKSIAGISLRYSKNALLTHMNVRMSRVFHKFIKLSCSLKSRRFRGHVTFCSYAYLEGTVRAQESGAAEHCYPRSAQSKSELMKNKYFTDFSKYTYYITNIYTSCMEIINVRQSMH